jgi:hypothetical protein
MKNKLINVLSFKIILISSFKKIKMSVMRAVKIEKSYTSIHPIKFFFIKGLVAEIWTELRKTYQKMNI